MYLIYNENRKNTPGKVETIMSDIDNIINAEFSQYFKPNNVQ